MKIILVYFFHLQKKLRRQISEKVHSQSEEELSKYFQPQKEPERKIIEKEIDSERDKFCSKFFNQKKDSGMEISEYLKKKTSEERVHSESKEDDNSKL